MSMTYQIYVLKICSDSVCRPLKVKVDDTSLFSEAHNVNTSASDTSKGLN